MASTRVREIMKMVSPTGKVFECKWRGGKRSFTKRLASFDYAGISGTVMDDYGVEGDTYPTEHIFDGEDYDIEADRFFEALKETGKWQITHPTKGLKGFQLVEASEDDQPVIGANLIRVEATWKEYIDPIYLKTLTQLSAELGVKVNAFNDAVAERFLGIVVLDSYEERAELKAAASTLKQKITAAMTEVAAKNDEVAKTFADSQRDMQANLAGVIAPIALAGQIKETIQAPMYATRDTLSRVRAIYNLMTEVLSIGEYDFGINTAAVKEAGISYLFGAIAVMSINALRTEEDEEDGAIETQSQAIYLINKNLELLNYGLAGLDVEQTKFEEGIISTQYFTLGEVGQLLNSMIASSQGYLKDSLFSLKRETAFTLRTAMSPMEATRRIYTTLGENDENYYLLIRSNRLTGDELFLLPSGKRLVAYV